ncbi:NAD-dependent protein deacetylase [Janthinobacterium lividum]|uniref:protein acetyllysine N-acetyltransferase n=1 Tax=Janthinobacterium lividum TaxID=29581 RepID=A0ABU0Y1G2_9BURK|nr:NAD-dependent protein deacetylase [Janthinobacterium lividum]MDQ4628421.1 NAD-dependent protein deacetylase [Janthinobacterium lividum]MDQ4676114.1 NAD-dependent protein deacetylase [Janthinobacterium lividum]MDQ4687379.1 NAD-dependent protein deacetylase [Janthinobacterium lividum]
MQNFSFASQKSASSHHALDQLAQFLQRHPDVLLLTGAGISTASGIPDYRDTEGIRRGNAPVQGPDFRRQEAVRRRYWARSMVGWPTLARATPNPGHLAIAQLARRRRIGGLVTQNVDGLHQQAGSPAVTELHGSIHGVVCLDCHTRHTRRLIQDQLERDNPQLLGVTATPAPDGDALLEPMQLATFHVPACPRCGGTLQPDVVFFGDGVPAACAAEAERKMMEAGALLVVGSSVMVYSSFRLCRMAAETGKPVAAINLGKTRADHLLAFKTEAPAQDILPLVAAMLD